MRVVSANFAVSDPIWEGIARGTYERIGGVVRDSHTKQVITWLHEIGSTQAAVTSTVGVAGSVSSILSLGISVLGFALVLHRLNGIQHSLKSMEDTLKRVEGKVDIAAYAQFEGAIKLAETSMRSSNRQHRTDRAQEAATKLLTVETLYRTYAEAALNEGSPFIYDYLRFLHLSYVAAARCYLKIDDTKEAVHHLQEGETLLRPMVERYVGMMLTSNPAVYLHSNLKGQVDLARLTDVFLWQDTQADENSVFEHCREGLFRKDHKEWAKNLPNAVWETGKPIPRKKTDLFGEITAEAFSHLPDALKRAEDLIETFQRLAGYSCEVETHANNDVPFLEWKKVMQGLETSGDSLKIVFLIPRFSKEYKAYNQVGIEVDL